MLFFCSVLSVSLSTQSCIHAGWLNVQAASVSLNTDRWRIPSSLVSPWKGDTEELLLNAQADTQHVKSCRTEAALSLLSAQTGSILGFLHDYKTKDKIWPSVCLSVPLVFFFFCVFFSFDPTACGHIRCLFITHSCSVCVSVGGGLLSEGFSHISDLSAAAPPDFPSRFLSIFKSPHTVWGSPVHIPAAMTVGRLVWRHLICVCARTYTGLLMVLCKRLKASLGCQAKWQLHPPHPTPSRTPKKHTQKKQRTGANVAAVWGVNRGR